MKKRIFAVFLACSMVLGVFSGCGETETTESQESGTLSSGETVSTQGEEKESVVIAMGPTSEPEAGFDPAFGWGAGEHVHEPLIQSTLTVTNTDLTIGYDLATAYSVSEDGLTWEVTIRTDAMFTDGEPLTAEDVAFTYNTVKETSSVNDFTMLDYAEAVDESTVVFHMTRAFRSMPTTVLPMGRIPLVRAVTS